MQAASIVEFVFVDCPSITIIMQTTGCSITLFVRPIMSIQWRHYMECMLSLASAVCRGDAAVVATGNGA